MGWALLAPITAVRAGVTSHFQRPRAAVPLTHEEVRRLKASPGFGVDGAHGAHAGRSLSDHDDIVEQVHLGLGGEGEVVVTFATWERGLSSKVLYGIEGDNNMSSVAEGQVSTYSTHICPTNKK